MSHEFSLLKPETKINIKKDILPCAQPYSKLSASGEISEIKQKYPSKISLRNGNHTHFTKLFCRIYHIFASICIVSLIFTNCKCVKQLFFVSIFIFSFCFKRSFYGTPNTSGPTTSHPTSWTRASPTRASSSPTRYRPQKMLKFYHIINLVIPN